jgi:hypothetical protein
MSAGSRESQDSERARVSASFRTSANGIASLPLEMTVEEESPIEAPVLSGRARKAEGSVSISPGSGVHGRSSSNGGEVAVSRPRASSTRDVCASSPGSETEGSKRQGVDLVPGEAGSGGSLETFKQVRRRLEEALRRPGMRISAESDVSYVQRTPIVPSACTR